MLSTYIHIIVFMFCGVGLIVDIACAIFAVASVAYALSEEDGYGCLLATGFVLFVLITTPAFIIGINWAI